MAFISELMKKTVTDIDGHRMGELEDLLAHYPEGVSHPIICAISIRNGHINKIIPYSNVTAMNPHAIVLNSPLDQIEPFIPLPDDLYMVRDVLDKQIIDINGTRVVRVNDLEIVRVGDTMVASNVDIGATGILRRVGVGKPVEKLFNNKSFRNFISWDDVELLLQDEMMRLKVSRDKIADLHPADIADIISDMNQVEGRKFIETLNVPQLADALEEVELDFQASLVQDMTNEKMADVLEEMSPDAAADLLAELPEERSQELLGLMDAEDAEDVRKLLTYPVESAGGLMTTEYVSVPIGVTAEQAINIVRDNAAEAETIYYVYVTDEEEHLLGVFSLSDLVLAKPETDVADFMHGRMVSAQIMDHQNHIAMLVAKYNLLAIPIVDEQNRIHGIVTSDDALDQIIPTAWKKRLPRLHKH